MLIKKLKNVFYELDSKIKEIERKTKEKKENLASENAVLHTCWDIKDTIGELTFTKDRHFKTFIEEFLEIIDYLNSQWRRHLKEQAYILANEKDEETKDYKDMYHKVSSNWYHQYYNELKNEIVNLIFGKKGE